MAKDKAGKPPPATTATTATRGAQPWSFERAVRYARGRLAKAAHMTDEKKWLDPTFRGLGMLASEPATLLKDARLKADAFDALRFGIAAKIERDEPLPDAEKAWAVGLFRGEIEAPFRATGAPTASGKHRAIIEIIADLQGYGSLKASRNNAAKIKESACDAVAVALRELKMEPKTFEGVRDVWKKRQSIAPERFAK